MTTLSVENRALIERHNCLFHGGAFNPNLAVGISYAGLNELLNAARAEARPAVDREGEPSEDFIRLVAEAMGARTGYSISLTRLVDGVETYTLSMDGYEPQDFDDRDEAAEVLHQRLNRDRAKRLLALLSPAVDREAVALIRELADSLEAEITARAEIELPRRVERDMEPVRRAREILALLSPATSPGEGSSSANRAARIASDHAASETPDCLQVME